MGVVQHLSHWADIICTTIKSGVSPQHPMPLTNRPSPTEIRSRPGTEPSKVASPLPTTKLCTRPPLERIKRIHELLLADSYPNCTSVAHVFEVNPKTIQRDVDFMRDRMLLPIGYSRENGGFYYTEPVSSLPGTALTRTEWESLVVARKALEQYRGCSWSPEINEALARVSSGFDDLLGDGGINELISFRNVGGASVHPEVFATISRALLRNLEVHFRFTKFSTARPDSRIVHPYHLACVDGVWHLIGLNVPRQQVRIYELSRIFSVKVTSTRFERPKNFSVTNILSGFFGITAGADATQLRLQFTGKAAWAIEQRQWHDSQRIEINADQSLTLTMKVCITSELLRWVLGWGAQVRVLEPASLARQVQEQAVLVQRAYAEQSA